jgi:hypothetical protein
VGLLLKKFTSYCTAQGIQMQHIVPYTPQQNGVVERKNHTLKEMANCMIQSKGLSLHYWVEAINCANYIVNHTPTKALKNITPEEVGYSEDVKGYNFFNLIPMKLLLEEMLNLMKISWPASLIQHLCHLRPMQAIFERCSHLHICAIFCSYSGFFFR